MNAHEFFAKFLPQVQALGTVAEGLPLPPQVELGIAVVVAGAMLGQRLLNGDEPTPEEWAAMDGDFAKAEAAANSAIAAARGTTAL